MASGWGRAEDGGLGEPRGGERNAKRLLCGRAAPPAALSAPSHGYLPFRPLLINRAAPAVARGSCPRPRRPEVGKGRRRRRGGGSRPRCAPEAAARAGA